MAVYCALLLSSALLLPRITFLLFDVEPEQLSSRDKPQHSFLVPLTAKPLFTVAYAVSAALLLQIGWARRMTQWSAQARLQSRTRWRRLSVRGMLFDLARGRTAELASYSRMQGCLWYSCPSRFTSCSSALALPSRGAIVAPLGIYLFFTQLRCERSHSLRTYALASLLSVLTSFPPPYLLGKPFDATSRSTLIRLFAQLSFVGHFYIRLAS